ncbi:LptA/OstA family protein [Leptotrichia sp. oral taxon 212]|uniref:LptA/OstA family protein n=1 Tax=Leptotrichia sp. oral taxon 212 TaxID=712357 RepID=UPI0006A9D90A|nr:LptA/OstA family protein [Leptotrichia sp. oral taxon 212]ALA95951.1 organic solvent tolerance protein OstA [Leptotrichia sp. oral taxon 212]
MWKKIAYGGLLAVLIYFLYAVFFKKIETPVDQMRKEMKAKKVIYKLKDDAIIYADEQIGSDGDKIIKFKNVVVDLLKKEMLISGKEGEINTETSDITLIKKVVGSTKDNKWNLYTEKVDYKKEGDKIISETRTRILNNVDKTEMESDKIETTTKFEEIVGTGNVIYKETEKKRELKSDKVTYNDVNKVATGEGNVSYKDDKVTITANKASYFMQSEEIHAEGNVKYKDAENNISGDRAKYFMKPEEIHADGNVHYVGKSATITGNSAKYFVKQKQVDATGNVNYSGKDLKVSANHVFYDEVKKIVNADGNGRFNYLPRATTGTFRSGVYDLANEILTTNDFYTMNYEDYRMEGTGLVYLFKTGDATFNSRFAVTKQNFTVAGDNGHMNTIAKNIFSNKMIMTSVQGDKITSNTGEGSFEKKEFRFDGNVNGKIRGNVKNFATNPTKLIEEEAVHFRGNTAKIYFISHNSKDMSVTRSEIKENVHMRYKEVNLTSQYNEIDTGKNLVLARDRVMLDFRNDTQMTSNFLYLDLNKEEGHAEKNVKIVSKLPQFANLNTSADKATVYMKEKKINLNGKVVTYQGKTKISSNNAMYSIDKKTLENTGNIKMQYHVQEGNDSSSQGKSDPKNVAAVEEVINKLSVSQNEVNSRGKINLPKTMNASNGVPVTIRWTTSNSSFLSITGKINKQFLGGDNKSVVLKAVAKVGNDSREKSFNVNIPVETTREMLERAARNIYLPETGKNLPSSVRVNIGKGTVDVPIVWMSGGNRVQSAADAKGLTAILNYQGTEYKKQY